VECLPRTQKARVIDHIFLGDLCDSFAFFVVKGLFLEAMLAKVRQERKEKPVSAFLYSLFDRFTNFAVKSFPGKIAVFIYTFSLLQ
jgi:hypothetical protein